MAGEDPVYGSEVTDGGGLFPFSDLVAPYITASSTNVAPVSDNSDVNARAGDAFGENPASSVRGDSDVLPLDLINEYEKSKPLHNLSQINDRKLDLPPAPTE